MKSVAPTTEKGLFGRGQKEVRVNIIHSTPNLSLNPNRNPIGIFPLDKTIKQLIVICEIGGDLKVGAGKPFGRQSRSLKAVYLLRKLGYSKIALVKDGMIGWRQAGLSMMEGGEEFQ